MGLPRSRPSSRSSSAESFSPLRLPGQIRLDRKKGENADLRAEMVELRQLRREPPPAGASPTSDRPPASPPIRCWRGCSSSCACPGDGAPRRATPRTLAERERTRRVRSRPRRQGRGRGARPIDRALHGPRRRLPVRAVPMRLRLRRLPAATRAASAPPRPRVRSRDAGRLRAHARRRPARGRTRPRRSADGRERGALQHAPRCRRPTRARAPARPTARISAPWAAISQ